MKSILFFLLMFVILYGCQSEDKTSFIYSEYKVPFKGYYTEKKVVTSENQTKNINYYVIYKQDGKIIKREDFDKKNNLVFTHEYFYTNNLITKSYNYNKDGTLLYICEYSYDSSGNRIKEIVYDNNNNKIREINVSYLK